MNGQTKNSGPPPGLAVIIPAWNERKNLELLLPALREVIADLGITAEIVVVDGGSHDGTREAGERWGAIPLRRQPSPPCIPS